MAKSAFIVYRREVSSIRFDSINRSGLYYIMIGNRQCIFLTMIILLPMPMPLLVLRIDLKTTRDTGCSFRQFIE